MSVTQSIPSRRTRLKILLTPPVFEDEEKTRVAGLANAFLLALLVLLVLATLAISLVIARPIIMIVTGIGMCLPTVVALLLLRRGYVRVASIIFVATLWLILNVLGLFSGGVVNGSFAALILIVLIAGLLLGGKAAIIVVGLSMASVTGVYVAEIAGYLPPPLAPLSSVNYWVTHLVNYVIAGSLIYLTVRNLAEALNRARRNEKSLAQSNQELHLIRESLEQRVTQRTAQLEASAEVGRTATAILNPDQLLKESVNLITNRFDFYYTAVFTPDETGTWLVLRQAAGDAGRVLKEGGHKLALDKPSMVSDVFTQHKPRIALNVGTDAVDFANPVLPETRSEMALPLIVGNRVLGVLNMQSKQVAAFDEASAAVLQSMADQIAVAFNNAQLFEQTEQQAVVQANLNQLNRALFSASDTETLYRTLANQIGNIMPYDYLSLTLAQSGSPLLHEYELRADMNPVLIDGPTRATSTSLSGRACNTRQIAFSNNTARDAASLEDMADLARVGLNSAASVPLLLGDRVLGTFNLARRQSAAFLDRDLALFSQLSGPIAAAMENRRLAEAQQRSLQELQSLTRQLTQQAWSEKIQQLPDRVKYVQYSRSGVKSVSPMPVPELETAIGTARPAGWTQSDDQLKSSPYQATLAAPITLRGEVLGGLQVGEASRPRVWSEEDITFIKAVADQVAVALDNARLIEQTQNTARREKQIAQAADKIHRASDLDEILQTAIEEISRITGSTDVGIQLRAESTLEPEHQHDHQSTGHGEPTKLERASTLA
jgi:GAF domain-containing protein